MSRRVLIARLDSLGDVLLAGPAVRAVAAGGAHVTLLCGPRGAPAACLLPGVREVIVWRAEWIDPEPQPIETGRIEALIAQVGARRFEEALIFTSFHQSPLPLALLLRMAGVKRVAANSVDYPGSLLDVRHDCPDDVHEVVRSLSLAVACGHAPPTGDDRRLRVCSSAPLHPDAAALRPYVVVHPGASVGARAWSAERHRELVRLLLSEGHNVLLTGAPDERPLTTQVGRGFAAKRLAGQGALLDLAGETYLDELAEVFAAADAIVVANTGPAHLAAAVGTPIVSLFAPTVPSRGWRPWGVPHELLNCEVPCAGCRARTCPVAGHPCLEGVSARAVLEALRALLARTEEARVHPLPARQAPPRELAVRRSSESREIAA